MSHRAEQIIEAVAASIRAFTPSSISVFTHRRLSLAAADGELPAITVDFGEDQPTDGDGSYLVDGTIQSLLTVNITGVATDVDEVYLRRKLLEMRTHAHVGIKQVNDLGLPFVIDTHYGGALPPEIDVSGDEIVGELTSQWGVRYELQLNNPE